MTRNEAIGCFTGLKHRLENDMELLRLTPPDVALGIARERGRILVSRLDRKAVSEMPCSESIRSQALSMLDDAVAQSQADGLRFTVLIVGDKRFDLLTVAMVTWDDDEKIALTVVHETELVVIDEHS